MFSTNKQMGGKLNMSDSKLILVVDDDTDLVEMVSMKLESGGFRVAKAYDGIEAMDRIKEVRPDLIILDVMMPRKDGYTL
jgi:CheY-like chemotaxis protein